MKYLSLLKYPYVNTLLQKIIKHTSSSQLLIVKQMMEYFCASEKDLPSAITKMKQSQYHIILDYAMEQNKRASIQTKDTILKNMERLDSMDFIALKPSSLLERDLERILDICKEKRQKIMIDAEEYEYQQKVHLYIRTLQEKYNTRLFPCIYNTYQCYLKTTYKQIMNDIEYFDKIQLPIAIKLVRGAYLEYEIQNAQKKNLPIPVFESIHQTNVCYNRCMLHTIQHAKEQQVYLNIATHNPNSIQLARQYAKPYDKHICFSQLKGIRDDLSQKLLLEGYIVYKYLPYGEYSIMVPYLLRRLQESKMNFTTIDYFSKIV
uniref:Proline dehydrogenase domain-containing protein n=1 Tax=viral metagenome TaxID=1070528 RepID=A0A6C0CRF3_9ZZZZ